MLLKILISDSIKHMNMVDMQFGKKTENLLVCVPK